MLALGTAYAQLPAFPGAEGFGAYATGGRGKEVYHVTNLEDSGNGSFRDAVSQAGRTVVFDLSGIIKMKSRIDVASDITIAGQTAPGQGITLYGQPVAFNKVKNVIARYIRFHGSINMSKGNCTLVADSSDNIIFDHVSVAWGRWDNIHIKGSSNITMQYCLIGEGLDPQRFGALLERPVGLTIHHCLWINNQSRNPKAKARIDFVNNVIYNWGGSGFIGGHSAADHYQDLVNNYFIAGPSSSENFLSMFTATDHVYQSGNMVDMDRNGKLNGRLITGGDFTTGKLAATLVDKKQNLPALPVTVDKPETAVQKVLTAAGASLQRDKADQRMIAHLQSLGKEGTVIWTELQAGGEEKTEHSVAAQDTDQDGIPDAWEKQHGLKADEATDGSVLAADGYSQLEHYLEALLKQ